MKLKKYLVLLISILIGCSGLLFGCNPKPLKLDILYKDISINSVTLNLPINSDTQSEVDDTIETTPEEELNNLGDNVNILLKAENVNDMFKNGLIANYNNQNIKLDLVSFTQNSYEYKITALKAENTEITFQTKDKKVKKVLKIYVNQDCEKIEKNVQSANFVVFGEDKELSTTMLSFTPNTTTNKNITYSFKDGYIYDGVTIENNKIVFDKTKTEIKLNNVIVNQLVLTATHINYENADEDHKANYIVEDIVFDILSPINNLVALKDNVIKTELQFASNVPSIDSLNYITLNIKKSLAENNFIDIDNTYSLEYYLENKDDLVIIDDSEVENFNLTISQNFRSGENVLIIKAVNKIQPSYTSSELRIKIIVKTYPTYISVNGNKNPDEIILYDNGNAKSLLIEVGDKGSYNTNFKISGLNEEYLSLKYSNGLEIRQGNDIESGTELFLSVARKVDLNEQSFTFNIISSGSIITSDNGNNVTTTQTTINVRIVKNLTDVNIGVDNQTIKYDLSTLEYSISKLDNEGNLSVGQFNILKDDSTYIPPFTVEIANDKILKLEKINYSETETNFLVKALSSGKTDLTIIFDNGLEKTLTVNVYVKVSRVEIDFDEETKSKVIGNISKNDDDITVYALKQGKNANLLIKPYDYQGNLILDYSITNVEYSFENNNANIAISNTDNVINAINLTQTDVIVTASFSCYDYNGDLRKVEVKFGIKVYLNVESVNIVKQNEVVEYIELYSKNSLGYEDYNLSKVSLALDINPYSASEVKRVYYQANFNNSNVDLIINNKRMTENTQSQEIKKNKLSNVYELTIEAIDVYSAVEIGTITFSVQEFNIIYTKKITVKITKAESPTTILVENVNKLTDADGNTRDYLYFNLGIDGEVKIYPKVYPLNSYNLNYIVKIENTSSITEQDPIKFSYNDGLISPLSVGECKLILIPKGIINEDGSYDTSKARVIYISVADGETIPYKIENKNELLKLCTTTAYKTTTEDKANFKQKLNEKYTKKYVLTKDIDLTGENIYPIGFYLLEVKGPFTDSQEYVYQSFTGSFSGEFEIDGVKNNYSITGINFDVNKRYVNNINDGLSQKSSFVGLFAKNEGTIKNLNVVYSRVSINALSIEYQLGKENANLSYNLYFGGISGQNSGNILNTNVNVYNADIKTYLYENFIGGITGLNSGNITNCNILGNINAINGYDNFSYLPNKIYVGGISASNENTGVILGKGVILNSEEIFNKESINSTINLTSLVNDKISLLNSDSAFGLIAGKNSGVINKMSSYGRIYAYQNIGGLVGINSGEITNSYSFSSLQGKNNVGGLVGKSLSGALTNNATLLLDDDETFIVNNNFAKIVGENFVGGLIGSEINTTNMQQNYIRSFVIKTENYYDLYAKSNFGAIYVLDGFNYSSNIDNAVIGSNFADNLLVYLENNQNSIVVKGSVNGLGLVAPSSISAEIKESTLTENSTVGYNKFIKCSDNTIILYNFKGDNKIFNKILKNYLFSLNYVYENEASLQNNQKGKINKIESDNNAVISIDDYGNIKVVDNGEARLKIYSLLNKNAKTEIIVKVINAIEIAKVYEDSLLETEIENNLIVKKDSSINIYLAQDLRQNDIYVEYTFDKNYITINNSLETTLTNSLQPQVIKGIEVGTSEVIVKFKVKIGENYYYLPYEKTFNVTVSSGLKNLFSDVTNISITKNSFVDFNLTVETDLVDATNIVIEQYSKNLIGEYLNCNLVDINKGSNNIKYNFNISVKDKNAENVTLKIYVIDKFVNLNEIKNDLDTYSKYYKIINVNVETLTLINADLEYYADGELIKNNLGQDVYNPDELESEFIKIGKVGVLKINLSQINNLELNNEFSLTYTNLDNYNLTLKQVKKVANGYEDVATDTIINNGIILDKSYMNEDVDGNYLYVKMLTDSNIRENSVFNLQFKVSGYDYYFTKQLISKMASNIEISFNGAILNSSGELEGVYAKGVESQKISLTINKLNAYNYKAQFINCDYAELNLVQTTVLGDDSVRYDFSISNLTQNDVVKLYFYLDKTINGKTERYITKTLKLNVVDFVITGSKLEGVTDGYFNKPLGTNYPLKIKLDTINNSSTEVLNKIANLENEISKNDIFNSNGSKLTTGSYENYEVFKTDYYYLKPLKVVKTTNFNYNFNVVYNGGDYKVIVSKKFNKYYFEEILNEKYYSINQNSNFGINFYLQTDINNPVPIYTQEEFENMGSGANYILLNDLTLTNYTPKDVSFNSFDGNGYKITVDSLNINLNEVKEEYKFGLFASISENTTIKNVTLKYNLSYKENTIVEQQKVLNFKNIQTLYFGGLVGENNGLIYNCVVEEFARQGAQDSEALNITTTSIINDSQTISYIGGLVSVNNGVITNSRSLLQLTVSKGYVSGFVSENNGTISACYYKNAKIKNLGEDETTSVMAGFVYQNNGKILTSYVQGEVANLDGRYVSKTSNEYSLTSPTNIGGFVYENLGTIEDCYSNLSITSNSYSGGFVYVNNGQITRSYSACLNSKENNIAHAPFIATKVAIDENEMKQKIKNCYYLTDSVTSTINDNLVLGLTLKEFNEEYNLTNFVLDEVWKLNDGALPSLVSANNIALSKRSLYSAIENDNGSIIYSYVYDEYYFGSEYNPITIANEQEFLNYFSLNNDRNNYYYRLINNIDFNEYSSLPTSNYIFSGSLDGNGLEITNMSISANVEYNQKNFGLFGSIVGLDNKNSIIKNLTIKPLEVYANNIENVGTLAGKVENAKIINIKIDAKNVIVQGKNIVGGVVGLVKGNSELINIESNVSVNANYYSSNNVGENLYDSENRIVDDLSTNSQIAYAGGVVGVIDVNKSSANNERVRNIVVNDDVKVIGSIVGLVAGLVGENSGLDNIKVNVSAVTYLNSRYSAGLISGENRGYINRVQTIDNKSTTNLFRGTPKFIGGVTGFNNSGTITNSILSVNVESLKALVAGGVAGITCGGSFSSIYSKINVKATNIAGGIVGYATRKNLMVSFKNGKINNADNVLKTNNIVYVSNCISYSNVETLAEIGRQYIGGIFGAVHNTSNVNEGEISNTIKNSYITYNNYYKNITKQISETNIFKLNDFGAYNLDDIDSNNATINNNYSEEKSSAKAITELSLECFNNFSKNVFDLTSLDNIKLKELNNINTKKLVGDGTINNPYELESVAGLNELSEIAIQNEKVYINLVDNIEATGKEVKSIGDGKNGFNGTFNGNGKFINGLTYLNSEENYTQNYFGLFGNVLEGATIKDLNVVANFVINYGSNINYTGIIAGYNKGYISRCNVYGGMICVLENIKTEYALSYVGGIVGLNAGRVGYGIVDSTNYATMYVTIQDEENSNNTNLQNVTIYSGLVVGCNLGNASITRCKNLSKTLNLNSGAKDYSLIVINGENESCKTYANEICGFGYTGVQNNSVVYNNKI